MKNNGTNRSPVLRGTLKALGLAGVLGMAGAIVLIGPLAGSGCNENNAASGGSGGHFGSVGGSGGARAGVGGSGGSAVDAGGDGSVVSPTATNVLVQNFQYMPARFTVAPGASIVVHNTDTMSHTMTSESATDAVTPGASRGRLVRHRPDRRRAPARPSRSPRTRRSARWFRSSAPCTEGCMQGMLTVQ